MEQAKIDMFLATNAKNFEPFQITQISEMLKNMPDSSFAALNSIDFKSPQTMLIVSLLAGGLGLDRFMLGDTGLGILKLVTVGGCGIWTIIDWFQVQGNTKKYNFNLLTQTIGLK